MVVWVVRAPGGIQNQALENIPLLGPIPHYHETLAPGEALGPFYLNFGLGENPRPGQQHWHPYFKTPVAGKYRLTHSVPINVASLEGGEKSKSDQITSGQIEFEIVAGERPATHSQADKPPAVGAEKRGAETRDSPTSTPPPTEGQRGLFH
jgi:hypothetical protein